MTPLKNHLKRECPPLSERVRNSDNNRSPFARQKFVITVKILVITNY